MRNRPLLLGRRWPNRENANFSRTSLRERSLRPLVTSALILSLLVVSAVIPSTYGVGARTRTSSSTVSTAHLTVELSFPYSADLGQSITISATTTAKSNGKIVRFWIDIFSNAGGQLVRLASRTIVTDTIVKAGGNWQTWIPVVIPTNAQRGPLIGRATEVWQETPYYYYAPYCSYYQQDYYQQNYYQQNYYPQNYPYYNTFTYNAPQYVRYPNGYNTYSYNSQQYARLRNGITALPTSPQYRTQSYVYDPAYAYQPSYVCQPASSYGLGYASNYGSNYAPNYASQVSSEQTFPLTYVPGCYYP